MAAKRCPVSRSRANVAIQAQALRGRFPGSEVNFQRRAMIWTASLQPTTLSRVYTVQVSYSPSAFPRVKILSRLKTRSGEPLPHVCREGVLCLHKVDEWSPQMLIADSIVPWTCEWLIQYEIWLATGEWHGGGEDPN